MRVRLPRPIHWPRNGPRRDSGQDDLLENGRKTDPRCEHQIVEPVKGSTEDRNAEVLQGLGDSADGEDGHSPHHAVPKKGLVRDPQNEEHGKGEQDIDQVPIDKHCKRGHDTPGR